MQFAHPILGLILFLLGISIPLTAQQSSLSGRISDAGSGDGLIGANVVLTGPGGVEKGTGADAYGNYQLTEVAPGRYTLEVSYLGYLKVVKRGFLVGSGPNTNQNFALLPDPDLTLTPIELTFFRNDPVVNPLKREVSLEEVRRLPATFYDPARLLALSPGVVQTNDQANHLSVRGNSPNRNLWRLQGLAIVNPNHTANAGTINDQATLNGGGVNALSAQLLDNSTFYSGGLPAAYGNATAGTLDMRLRPGNTEKARHQLQAGFIGFDLATEGPIAKGKPNTGSYLVNYRYSFTGLLADLGADFGGEEIRFQDFSLHLFQPVGRNGELSVFGLLGNSSNEFTGKDEDFEEDKELFDIDFKSELAIGGLTYEHYALGGKISFGAVLSGVANDRRQVLRNTNFLDADNNGIRQERLSSRLEYGYAGGDYFRLRAGLEHLREGVVYGFENTDTDKSYQNIASPYLEIQQRFGPVGLTAGLRYSAYLDLNDSDIWEPRLLLNYYAGKSLFHLSAERSSRLPIIGLPSNSTTQVSNAVVATNQFGLGWQYALPNNDAFSINAYYQESPDDYAAPLSFLDGTSGIFPSNDLLGTFPFFLFERSADFRSYGLELSYQRPIQPEQLYYTANLSVFRAENQTAEGDWVQGRFSRDFIFQGVAGKEWEGTNKKGKARAFGANVSLTVAGGERFFPVNEFTSAEAFVGVTDYDFAAGRSDQMDTYFRPDLRLYRRKYHRKTTTTLALDIQNLSGQPNVAYRYYDHVTEQVEDRLQLGIIPVLSYRIEWR